MADEDASNGSYVISAPGIENLTAAPQNDSSIITINFSINTETTYYIYGRLNNPKSDNDAFWIKIDNNEFELVNDLTTNGWQWMELKNHELTAGSHSISLAIAEDSVSLDKIVIKSYRVAPLDLIEEANNICKPEIYVTGIDAIFEHEGYVLEQNYPNPFTMHTTISFKIQKTTYVSLKVFDMHGQQLAELAGKVLTSGKHKIEFDNRKLLQGSYFYTISTDEFFATRKMIVTEN